MMVGMGGSLMASFHSDCHVADLHLGEHGRILSKAHILKGPYSALGLTCMSAEGRRRTLRPSNASKNIF